jgi:hypothetical protein
LIASAGSGNGKGNVNAKGHVHAHGNTTVNGPDDLALNTTVPLPTRMALENSIALAKQGRTINVHPMHEVLHEHRRHQQADTWQADYKAIRPKVERKNWAYDAAKPWRSSRPDAWSTSS